MKSPKLMQMAPNSVLHQKPCDNDDDDDYDDGQYLHNIKLIKVRILDCWINLCVLTLYN